MLRNKTFSLKLTYTLVLTVFLGFVAWWVYNRITYATDDPVNALFSDSYWILAFIGGIVGIWAAQKWGGLKSVLGRSIIFFALGLLAQVFGQVIYTYYARIQHIEAPYPSIGDIGYFGSVVFYIIAIYLLAKTAGANLNHSNSVKKVIAIILPVLLLLASYVVFLRNYEVDFSHPLRVFLDFGYPLGQAIYVSLALLTYFLSKGLLGGIMKNKVLFLLAALVVQYGADYAFLYRFNNESWYPGDVSDLIYLASYLLMAIALLKIGSTATALNQRTHSNASI